MEQANSKCLQTKLTIVYGFIISFLFVLNNGLFYHYCKVRQKLLSLVEFCINNIKMGNDCGNPCDNTKL